MSARGTIENALAATLVGAACIAVAPTIARADDAAPPATAALDDKALAEKLLTDGLAQFDAGNFTGAARTWETLLRDHEASAWRILYNLGLAYRNAGQIDLAVERFERFLRRVGAEATALDAPLEERRQDAAEQVALLRPKVAMLSVRGAGETREVLVTVDDRAPRAAGFDTYVMPGRHTITFGEGRRARRVTVEVAAGETRTVDAPLEPATPPRDGTLRPPPGNGAGVPPRGASTATQSNAGPIAVGVLAGATALSFALPIGLGVHAGNVADAARSLGRGHTRYDDAIDSYEDARTAYYVSYVLPGVLGAAAITTFAVVALAPSGGGTSDTSGAADASRPPAPQLSIAISSNGAGPGVTFRWDF